MKKFLSTLFGFLFLMAAVAFGQGFENFANYPETTNAYHDGTFPGQDGSTWSYFQCRGDSVIIAPSPTLGKNRVPTAEVRSGDLNNGCGTLEFDYKQVFTSNVSLDVFVNGLLVHSATTSGEQGVVKHAGPITVNTPGTFVLDFKQQSVSSGQVTIDNVSWTEYNSGPLPEPTNYPTSFAALPLPNAITLSWVDATGEQLPTAYLVLGSDQDNIQAPIDGTPVPDNPNLSGGTGALNIITGAQGCQFSNLQGNHQYFFKIFPYTNTGANINYKTDGTPPAANATVPNYTIINSENFDDGTFGTWGKIKVVGDTNWIIDMTHGVGGTACAKMSGYFGGASHQTETWLVSPVMNFDQYHNEVFSFQTAKNYTGPALETLISNNYNGSGNPNDFTWTPLTATLCPGGWAWTPSGNIDVSGTSGEDVYLAFKYTSTETESSTWEVDDILVMGVSSVGVPEVAGSKGFSVAPNPARENVRVILGDASSKTIRILSILGAEVFSVTTSQMNLYLSVRDLAAGIYFIEVKYADSERPEIRKLIVQ